MKFTDFKKADKANVLVVDALNLCFRWKHSGVEEFADEFCKVVASLAQSYHCGTVIITADKGTSSYRKAIHPGYKQGRKDKFEKQTEAERVQFQLFFEEYERALELARTKYTVFRYDGVEADDLAAYIVKCKDKCKINEIWLMSSDKDWDLLIQPGVSRFSYVTRKETRLDNWNEHYDCEPDQYMSLKCLMGDSGDSIEGVEGLGPKRSATILESTYDIFEVIDCLPLPGKQKFIQNLNKSKDLLLRNIQLIDLVSFCEDAIGKDNLKDMNGTLSSIFVA